MTPTADASKTTEKTSGSKKQSASPSKSGVSMAPPAYGVALADEWHGGMPAVQARGELNGSDIHGIAAEGTRGSGQQLPFLSTIQNAFGPIHDMSKVIAHVGAAASSACRQMGALAYTMGDHVAFAGTPDLHTAVHEATHVIQQRSGVQLKDGVGRVGDSYERHADEVANEVVQGRSVAGLLNGMGEAGLSSQESEAVQLKVYRGYVYIDGLKVDLFSRSVSEWHEFLRSDADEELGSVELTGYMRSLGGVKLDDYPERDKIIGRKYTQLAIINCDIPTSEAYTLLEALTTSPDFDAPNNIGASYAFDDLDRPHGYAKARMYDGFYNLVSLCGAGILNNKAMNVWSASANLTHYAKQVHSLEASRISLEENPMDSIWGGSYLERKTMNNPNNLLMTQAFASATVSAVEVFDCYAKNQTTGWRIDNAFETLRRMSRIIDAVATGVGKAQDEEKKRLLSTFNALSGFLAGGVGMAGTGGAGAGAMLTYFQGIVGGVLENLLEDGDPAGIKGSYKYQFGNAIQSLSSSPTYNSFAAQIIRNAFNSEHN